MKRLKFLITAALIALVVPSSHAQTDGARTVDELLRLIEQGVAKDAAEQRRRIQAFEADLAQQTERLNAARAELRELESRSAAAEQQYQTNEARLAEQSARLNERLGALRELFGVLQQTAGDFRGVVQSSLVSAQYPAREAFLGELIEKAGSGSRLPSIEELERLWFEMQRQAIESGKSVKFNAEIVDPNGDKRQAEVTRVGEFNAVAGGDFLYYDGERGNLVELARQPARRYTSVAADYARAPAGRVEDFWIDPSRGSILALLIQTPNLMERVHQGGIVGYVIIALGVVGLLLFIERLIALSSIEGKVRRQMKSAEPSDDNPLGRVMATYQKYRGTDQETLELRLTEAIAQETPTLTRFLPLLKIISVVAPLLGLLGTVTGMINTFQAITLFGTGDPKLMAGGISQALVTTVQGLCVAIPTVLLHTIAQGRAKRIAQVIEERAVGIMAEHAETEGHVRAA
ncbi:MotA/TolQ/ExbB proton channel family protein [Sinimarinibacterium thermocellulolyticum]|uniref:MotA/TolQ/ExbB proton channel family protein n=1 Tax=Sinimarinibacterium thermocellulolyticum TaxID=3170016 RepID=A0ABV2ACX6_9GAMM